MSAGGGRGNPPVVPQFQAVLDGRKRKQTVDEQSWDSESGATFTSWNWRQQRHSSAPSIARSSVAASQPHRSSDPTTSLIRRNQSSYPFGDDRAQFFGESAPLDPSMRHTSRPRFGTEPLLSVFSIPKVVFSPGGQFHPPPRLQIRMGPDVAALKVRIQLFRLDPNAPDSLPTYVHEGIKGSIMVSAEHEWLDFTSIYVSDAVLNIGIARACLRFVPYFDTNGDLQPIESLSVFSGHFTILSASQSMQVQQQQLQQQQQHQQSSSYQQQQHSSSLRSPLRFPPTLAFSSSFQSPLSRQQSFDHTSPVSPFSSRRQSRTDESNLFLPSRGSDDSLASSLGSPLSTQRSLPPPPVSLPRGFPTLSSHAPVPAHVPRFATSHSTVSSTLSTPGGGSLFNGYGGRRFSTELTSAFGSLQTESRRPSIDMSSQPQQPQQQQQYSPQIDVHKATSSPNVLSSGFRPTPPMRRQTVSPSATPPRRFAGGNLVPSSEEIARGNYDFKLEFSSGPQEVIFKDTRVSLAVRITVPEGRPLPSFSNPNSVRLLLGIEDTNHRRITAILKGPHAGDSILLQDYFDVPVVYPRMPAEQMTSLVIEIPNVRIREVSRNHGTHPFVLIVSVQDMPTIRPAVSDPFKVKSERVRAPSYKNQTTKTLLQRLPLSEGRLSLPRTASDGPSGTEGSSDHMHKARRVQDDEAAGDENELDDSDEEGYDSVSIDGSEASPFHTPARRLNSAPSPQMLAPALSTLASVAQADQQHASAERWNLQQTRISPSRYPPTAANPYQFQGSTLAAVINSSPHLFPASPVHSQPSPVLPPAPVLVLPPASSSTPPTQTTSANTIAMMLN